MTIYMLCQAHVGHSSLKFMVQLTGGLLNYLVQHKGLQQTQIKTKRFIYKKNKGIKLKIQPNVNIKVDFFLKIKKKKKKKMLPHVVN